MGKTLTELALVAAERADQDAAESADLPPGIRDMLAAMDAERVLRGDADPARIAEIATSIQTVLAKRKQSWTARLKEAEAVTAKLKGEEDDGDGETAELERALAALRAKSERSLEQYTAFRQDVEASQAALDAALRRGDTQMEAMRRLPEVAVVSGLTNDLIDLIRSVRLTWGQIA